MLGYQLRLAWKSLRRNPVLSALMVAGIALGIGVSSTFVTIYYVLSGDPIPHKSDRLFWVQLDSWDATRAWDADEPQEPPDQLTYIDAMALRQNDIPTLQTPMYKALLTVHPDTDHGRPFREVVRLCTADFFELFDVPFVHGGAWSRDADVVPEPVVVIDAETSTRLFGDENGVGHAVRIEDREFTVVGVIDRWRPVPKYYDTLNGSFDEPEAIYMPFDHGPGFEVYSAGNISNWKSYDGNEFEDFLQSESVWIQYWVQLDDDAQRERYASFLDAYVTQQKRLGRFPRPLNNRLRDVGRWLEVRKVVDEGDRAFVVISLLFLLICSVNLIGILLGKFLARAPEVGVRRALGASRRWVFVQHLIECELIGVLGGLTGLLLAVGGLRVVERLFDAQLNLRLDLTMVVVGVAMALVAAMIAGVYPAWRICRVQPGLHLKTQ